MGIPNRLGLSGSAPAHAVGRGVLSLLHGLFSSYDFFMVSDEQVQE